MGRKKLPYKRKRCTIWFPERVHKEFKAIAKGMERSLSSLVVVAVREYIINTTGRLKEMKSKAKGNEKALNWMLLEAIDKEMAFLESCKKRRRK